MDRSALAASILKIDGIVLLLVAAIHLSATPLVPNFVSSQSTAAGYAQIKPLFLLSFTVVGILLIPIWFEHFLLRQPDTSRRPLGALNLLFQCDQHSDVAGCPHFDHARQILQRDTVSHGDDSGLTGRHLDFCTSCVSALETVLC
jgi:hypothetical protein